MYSVFQLLAKCLQFLLKFHSVSLNDLIDQRPEPYRNKLLHLFRMIDAERSLCFHPLGEHPFLQLMRQLAQPRDLFFQYAAT